jgi:acyl-CoA thioesterase FadM
LKSSQQQRSITVCEGDLNGFGALHLDHLIRWVEETEYEFLRSRQLSVSLTDERGQFGFPRLDLQLEVLHWPAINTRLLVQLTLEQVTYKKLRYTFSLEERLEEGESRTIARGTYSAACCRFPAGTLPFPILIPDWVLERLA